MDVRSGNTQGPLLQRQVQPPERHHTGLGVMLVAATAMFFAVASSAFLLRAQMPPERCFHRHRVTAPPAPQAPVMAPDRAPGCGEATYQNNPDGTVSVVFDLCPGQAAAPAAEQLIDVELVPMDGAPASVR